MEGDLDALARDLGFVLKSEQKENAARAAYGLWIKPDNAEKQRASSVECPTIIVICPLKSIMEEITNEFSLSAAELRRQEDFKFASIAKPPALHLWRRRQQPC